LGLIGKYGVAIIVSFLAREVFVGTLGTLFGIEGADEAIDSLANKIQADGLSLGSGMALLVFYALAMQCVSTLAVLKSETGGYKVPSLVFLGYTFIAYLFALITFQIF
jgi:ferrous iron transport protein B